ncbi:cytochrome P450 4C1-like [Sitophilus oryzae]|uniref:Cytochrome P450 4C1-like n=1 Tax=Sitophilus oryzae TaxID=7048 RepID=A0A6J2XWT3_SITOR|nr:cytochrome P450 4C1-like [Sitophilus oryzae]XP_030755216.1 cytochrome P450 4C1-like [Sitophilus oryzae]XP_030755217.1 cytochrome P450 4C1-like [Sitophilus oryzae]XP_030755218.1 cytochrome P450 4C1-like [Sitophilus oryzae]XP_030755219.1 cytochrome P450 4C1-like [Sitophilus oryzae]XP_030755220.1 cytochrome P450 4C1-like [Sitophilus oryzae]XP_030755221.1 cytochrome P450 4C1-like [Sitophilus oryzae]XP_030755222.1 cytochrome P450 4C1-like [Sitophilus oryzae]
MVLEQTLAVLLIAVALWTIISLYTKRNIIRFGKKYSHYTFYPIFGHYFQLRNKSMFDICINEGIKKGFPYGCWLGHNFYYATDDGEEIQTILTHPNSWQKSEFYNTFRIGAWNSILLLPEKLWKPRRKFLAKNFSQPILNSYVQIFYRNSETLIEKLKDVQNKNLFETFVCYAYDSFCETMTNKNYNIQTEEGSEVVKWIDHCQEILGDNIVRVGSGFFFAVLFVLTKTPKVFQLFKSILLYRNFTQQLIVDREQELKKNIDENKTLLDSIIKADKKLYFNRTIINDELVTFTFAAADTSGNTLAFLSTLLGMHPNIQNKLYEEILEEIGPDRPIEASNLHSLKYTERVILETLRLIPVIPTVGRYIADDIICGTKTIPKGVNTVLNIFGLHRNKKYWTDPLKFDPDRFLPEEIAKRPSYCYFPFSIGPRNCIGKTYALMNLKVAVANIVRNYEIVSNYKSVEEIDFRIFMTIKTKHNLDCRFKPRK